MEIPVKGSTRVLNDDGVFEAQSAQPLASDIYKSVIELLSSTRTSAIVAPATSASRVGADFESICAGFKDLASYRPFRVEREPPVLYGFERTSTGSKFYSTDKLALMLSQVGTLHSSSTGLDVLTLVSDRVDKLVDLGSFILSDPPTHTHHGVSVLNPDAVGIDYSALLGCLDPQNHYAVTSDVERNVILDADRFGGLVDMARVAMPDIIYRIHTAVTNDILSANDVKWRESREWLTTLALFKNMAIPPLLDVSGPEMIYVLGTQLPPMPSVIWSVPRCQKPNIMMHAALTSPLVVFTKVGNHASLYSLNASISRIDSFSAMNDDPLTGPIRDQLALIAYGVFYPNEFVINIPPPTGIDRDLKIRDTFAIYSRLIFTFGPDIFNIDSATAEAIDLALDGFIRMYASSKIVPHENSSPPLNFSVGGYDASRLRHDPRTGAGFVGMGVKTIFRDATPYPHVTRSVHYGGFEPILAPSSDDPPDHSLPILTELIKLLDAMGMRQVINYLNAMFPHIAERLRTAGYYASRITVSAFSPPDYIFFNLGQSVVTYDREVYPVQIQVSQRSIAHFFRTSTTIHSQSPWLSVAPVVESVICDQLSAAIVRVSHMADFSNQYRGAMGDVSLGNIWKHTLGTLPKCLKDMFDLFHRSSSMSVGEIRNWISDGVRRETLTTKLMGYAWEFAWDIRNIMLTDVVYIVQSEVTFPDIDLKVTSANFNAEMYSRSNIYTPTQATIAADPFSPSDFELLASRGGLTVHIARILRQGKAIKCTEVIRAVRFTTCEGMPSNSLTGQIPYEYKPPSQARLGLSITVTPVREVTAYLARLVLGPGAHPDAYASLLPPRQLMEIDIPTPYHAIGWRSALALVFRNAYFLKKQVTVVDLTATLDMGSPHQIE
ncbi:VP2 [St Croix River virus]|uniref:VP2 n=1 Tax=St Croix River virus TaxID=104581 RepID=Q9DSP8_9REOV|nr:VP2 [St Croix River virus]AAG34364.1 VP2 [St Croix River virus]